MTRRMRQVVDLYVVGKVSVLRDGSPVWVQALNPFEHDTARNEATIARARITMALKEHGSDEQDKVRMFFLEDGLDAARRKVTDARVADSLPRVIERFRNDPEWTEKLQILERGLAETAAVPTPEEEKLLEDLAEQYTSEVTRRLSSERELIESKYVFAEEDDLWADYLDWYIARRAAELQLAEYKLHQILYGTRTCEGVRIDGEHWDHSECNGHVERFFLEKSEVATAPEELIAELSAAADDIEMTVREAKNSDRQGSSSDSSPLPSEAEASTASTPTETRAGLPGTSSSPSPTASPSSALAS